MRLIGAPHCPWGHFWAATLSFEAALCALSLFSCVPADVGANLTDDMYCGVYGGENKRYHDPDLPAVLERAWAAGVQRIIVTGGSLEGSRAALALARTDRAHPKGP